MSIKQLLGTLTILFVIFFVVVILLNTFAPNKFTADTVTFITVTVPTFISEQIGALIATFTGIATTVGLALNKVNATKTEAAQTVELANNKANDAQNLATEQYAEADKLRTEKTALQTEIDAMKASRTEAEDTVKQQEIQIATLRQQNQELMNKLENRPTQIVEVCK